LSRETEKKVEWTNETTTVYKMKNEKYLTLNIPRPVFLEKVWWREGKALGSEAGKFPVSWR
jgi:hypothetical protein